MALTIVVRSGDSGSPPQISFDSPRIVIGRGEGCEVRLPDPSVSHRHASIRQRGVDYIVVDEGSTNGTFIGPVRLSPQAPRMLKTGDPIRVGRIWLEVRIGHAIPTQNAPLATRELALGLVANALLAQGEAAAVEVRVSEGPDSGKSLAIREFERPYAVGRGKDLDLPLDDVDASRRHVEIWRRGEQVLVRDLGSKNGSKLGGAPLPANKEQAWSKGLVLELGQNRLVYEDPVLAALIELERSADERMREDDSVDPPPVTSAEAGEPPALQFDSSASARPAAEAGPIAAVPARNRRATGGRRAEWTDFVVALLALLVLAASVLGLLWLFRSD
jgi:pSer/pThr/pTyr-binding forkhead associated (FHA) protein